MQNVAPSIESHCSDFRCLAPAKKTDRNGESMTNVKCYSTTASPYSLCSSDLVDDNNSSVRPSTSTTAAVVVVDDYSMDNDDAIFHGAFVVIDEYYGIL